VRRRVDQPAATDLVDQPVAGPQVAVQPGRGLGRSADLVEAARDPFQVGDGTSGQRVLVGRQAGERQQPLGPVELGPRRARLVREAATAGGATVLPTERRRTRGMERGQGATQVGLGAGSTPTRLDPREDQVVGDAGLGVAVGRRQDLGDRDGAVLTETRLYCSLCV
jgi:hypothetical protein